jgi:hypothetical protein
MADFIQQKIWEFISGNASEGESEWLKQKGGSDALELMTAFVAAPRFISKKIVQSETDSIPGFNVDGWSLVRLSRVWLLTQLDSSDKDHYIRNIETLFDTAEMNELVALYSALPLLAYPDQWIFRATDAVRSNMGFVFDAIALHNPFPERFFNEAAWNQLVLKTIFNDKPIRLIEGIWVRTNASLALTLSDFAHERWAAGRSVPAAVWRLVIPFINETLLADLHHLFQSGKADDQRAAALVAYESVYEPAKQLLATYPELETLVTSGELTWANLE